MKVLEQDKEYNCAVYALHFLLGLYDIKPSIEEIEKLVNPSIENGASHEDILRALHSFKIMSWSSNGRIIDFIDNLPALVNYQYDGDGHYGVIIGKTSKAFIMYNPYNAEIETIQFKEFEKIWYSERYGANWYMQLN
jgi:ABC-type bacteriocin/lantibiotic exporter with double-glycine peptidase domain